MALKEVPHEDVGRYGVIAPTGPVDADGVVPIGDLVEKPPVDEAPSDLIIIGRYVLTPDVFDEIAAGRIGALGEIQLTDALRAQAHRSPFHGVVSRIDRFDTGTPLGFLTAAIELGLRDPADGDELRAFLDESARSDGVDRPDSSASALPSEPAGLVDDERRARRRRTRARRPRRRRCAASALAEPLVAARRRRRRRASRRRR